MDVEYISLVSDIKKALPSLDVRLGESMSRHCSFRVGGPAGAMAFPASIEELEALCRILRHAGVRPFVMGRGTNLLPPDGAFDRFVVNTGSLGAVDITGRTLTAQCGASLAQTAVAAANGGLTGLEFAHGIPGSVGGGVVMNAGAYGGEMKDVVAAVEYLDEDLTRRTAEGIELGFSYRHSAFSEREAAVLSATFVLTPGDKTEIEEKMRELAAKRRASQPLDMPSAGSTFKRPAGGYAAALIDQAGLKGFAIGGAQVSEKHAGFVVNCGGATAADILRLMEHVQNTVLAASGILLEPEVRILEG